MRGVPHWNGTTDAYDPASHPEVMPMGAIGEPKREIFIPVTPEPAWPDALPAPPPGEPAAPLPDPVPITVPALPERVPVAP